MRSLPIKISPILSPRGQPTAAVIDVVMFAVVVKVLFGVCAVAVGTVVLGTFDVSVVGDVIVVVDSGGVVVVPVVFMVVVGAVVVAICVVVDGTDIVSVEFGVVVIFDWLLVGVDIEMVVVVLAAIEEVVVNVVLFVVGVGVVVAGWAVVVP